MTPERNDRQETGTHKRIRDRLGDDLQLDERTVDGVMTIVKEEVEPVDYVLGEWACDRCGKNKSTCMKGDERLCNACAFDDKPLESDADGA